MRGAIDNRIIYAAVAAVWLGVTLHAIIVPAAPYAPQASPDKLAAFARSALAGIQRQSVDHNQEYCGVIIESDAGELSTSQIYEGERAECYFDRFSRPGSHVIASFHTHGGDDPDYLSEFPSVDDVMGDMDERIAGFIATPGGRIWQVDWRSGVSHQLCGEACLEQDRSYRSFADEQPDTHYTLADLKRRVFAEDEAQ